MTDLSLRERLKWVICHAGGNGDLGCCYTDDCPQGCKYDAWGDKNMDGIATATVNALISYLTDHGLAIVPMTVSDSMNVAACHVRWRGKPETPAWIFLADAGVDASLFWDMYAAALKAAPPAAELLAGTKEKTNG